MLSPRGIIVVFYTSARERFFLYASRTRFSNTLLHMSAKELTFDVLFSPRARDAQTSQKKFCRITIISYYSSTTQKRFLKGQTSKSTNRYKPKPKH